MALSEDQTLAFYAALRKNKLTIKQWCEANGVNSNVFYQEIRGLRKNNLWATDHEELALETIEEYEKERDTVM